MESWRYDDPFSDSYGYNSSGYISSGYDSSSYDYRHHNPIGWPPKQKSVSFEFETGQNAPIDDSLTYTIETVSTTDAKAKFSDMLKRVQDGDEFEITYHRRTVARLIPAQRQRQRKFGGLDIDVPDDFDAPLPDDELVRWES